jgi:hypothetical protein
VISAKYCGEGLPNWATLGYDWPLSTPAPVDWPWSNLSPDGVPTVEDCSKIYWGSFGNTFSAPRGYQALYVNEDGIQDALGGFWGNVSAYFQTNDMVIGYELLNEPGLGNYWTHPWYSLHGVTDRYLLQPMYENL